MKYLIPSVLIGAVLNFFLFTKDAGTEVYPLWTAELNNMAHLEQSISESVDGTAGFSVTHDNRMYVINARGKILRQSVKAQSLFSVSGNGDYYVAFEKVGRQIQFHNITGEPFWKMKSREYPYLSYNGKLILLMNGDHSRVRIADYNGTVIGAGAVAGRLCTVIAFSKLNDNCAVGFADGTYYFINREGAIINRGTTPGLSVVKSMAVSNNGLYGAVHFGDTEMDRLAIIEFAEAGPATVKLRSTRVVKSPLHVSNDGTALVMDKNAVVSYTPGGKTVFDIAVPEMRGGQSVIDAHGDFYSASYTDLNGDGVLVVVRKDGTVLMMRKFMGDSYLVHRFIDDVIVAKGSTNLYCYSIHPAAR